MHYLDKYLLCTYTNQTTMVPVTTQPLGSILEAKPLHQGQKTRILGRGSQSCSHLYSTLPVPSQSRSFIPAAPTFTVERVGHSGFNGTRSSSFVFSGLMQS